MAGTVNPDVIVIVSDSDSDDQRVKGHSALSPLTNLKPLSHKKGKSKKTTVNRIKRQTKLDSYFLRRNLTNNATEAGAVDNVSLTNGSSRVRTKVKQMGQKLKAENLVLSPPRKAVQLKRSAEKGMSPQPKVSSKPVTRLTDLKGSSVLYKYVSHQLLHTYSN